MAAPALKGLLDEFRLVVGDEEAGASMYRYGKRCGSSLVESLGVRCSSTAEVLEALPLLLAESGLGLGLAEAMGESIAVTISDSLETRIMRASDLGGCHFTSGYIAGIVGAVLGKKCECQREECISSGSCVFTVALYSDENGGEGLSSPGGCERLPLEDGTIYLLKEEKPDKSYAALVQWIGSGEKALCVTRDFPGKLRKKYLMGDARIVWLSSIEGNGAVDPNKLSSIFFEAQMFMQENPSSLVLLSGLEFLSAHNGFLSVLKLIHLLSEQASVSGSVILIPINPDAFDAMDIANLERETAPFPSDI